MTDKAFRYLGGTNDISALRPDGQTGPDNRLQPGIGLALAQGLAEHGAEVVINGRDRTKVDTAVKI